MNPEYRAQLVQKIEEGIEKTQADIDRLKELTAPIAPENAIGRVSRMDAINNRSVNQAALRKSIQRLTSLKRAKEQANDTHFGLCRNCGNEIPIGRMLLLPESTLCVQCAQRN